MKLDFHIYTMHWVFWGAFGLTRIILRSRDRNDSRAADHTTRAFDPIYPERRSK